jgi:triacylglycerol lipase
MLLSFNLKSFPSLFHSVMTSKFSPSTASVSSPYSSLVPSIPDFLSFSSSSLSAGFLSDCFASPLSFSSELFNFSSCKFSEGQPKENKPTNNHSSYSDFLSSNTVHSPPLYVSPPFSSSTVPLLSHPVVLVHGLLGFDSLLSMDYFSGVREAFESRGVRVIVPRLPPAAPIEQRAQTLFSALKLDSLTPEDGTKFHLIGHSMGGLDSRLMITKQHGEVNRISSLVTLATPHHGATMADLILREAKHHSSPSDSSFSSLFQFPEFRLTEALERLHELSGVNLTGISNLTTLYMERFNEQVPMRAGTKYFSYGGECKSVWSHYYLQAKYLSKVEGPNDGLVSVKSSQYGQYIRTLELDHTQFIGMFAGGKHLQLFEEILELLVKVEKEEKESIGEFEQKQGQQAAEQHLKRISSQQEVNL